jgi:hypothetical protein
MMQEFTNSRDQSVSTKSIDGYCDGIVNWPAALIPSPRQTGRGLGRGAFSESKRVDLDLFPSPKENPFLIQTALIEANVKSVGNVYTLPVRFTLFLGMASEFFSESLGNP